MALTNAQLALALRIVGDVADTVPAGAAAVITRQAAVARALVTAHAPTAPEDVADEAVIRLVGFLYDQSPAMPRSGNAMIASGAASILGPWHVARLVIPAGDQGDGAAIVALDGPAIVAALSALAGNARLPASAVRDLPSGPGGGLTADQLLVLRAAVQIGSDTPSLSGRSIEFTSDSGASRSINLEGVTHPVPESRDVGRVLKATGPGTSDWQTEGAKEGGSGLTESQVDARVNALVPAKSRVPAVGSGDVGRILTAPQQANGQPVWLSNPGQTQAQVDGRVRAGVADWAESGNTDNIPLSKLGNAPSGGGGLSQAEVDARVKAGVYDWAEQGDGSLIPDTKLSRPLDDWADALNSDEGFQEPANDAAAEAFVASTFATAAKPANASSSFGAFVNQRIQGARQERVYAVIRLPAGLDRDLLRLVVGSGALQTLFPGSGWTQIEAGDPHYWTAGPIANVPVGSAVRVQRFHRITLTNKRIRLPGGNLVTELLDATRGIAVAQFNRTVQQPLTAFTTPLTLQSSDHGVLFVSVQASVSPTARVRLGDDVEDTSQQFLSVLRGTDAYAGDSGTKGNGVMVATFDVHNVVSNARGSMQGTVTCYVARNAANQAGSYAVYEPETGAAGTAADSVALRWEVTLLRTDASAAAAPMPAAGLMWTQARIFNRTNAQGLVSGTWYSSTLARLPAGQRFVFRFRLANYIDSFYEEYVSGIFDAASLGAGYSVGVSVKGGGYAQVHGGRFVNRAFQTTLSFRATGVTLATGQDAEWFLMRVA